MKIGEQKQHEEIGGSQLAGMHIQLVRGEKRMAQKK